VYGYLKRNLSFSDKNLASVIWAKNFCKEKRKQQFQHDTNKKIELKLQKEHIMIYLYYFLFEGYYTIKANYKILWQK